MAAHGRDEMSTNSWHKTKSLNALYICMPWDRQVCRTRMEWTLADRMGTCAGGNNWSKFQKQQEGNIMLANPIMVLQDGAPPVISWFMNPINCSYICHKPKLWEL